MYTPLSVFSSKNALLQYNIAVAYYNLDKIEQAWKYYKAARDLDTNLKSPDIEMKYLGFINKQADSSQSGSEKSQ
jgi:hypothetical protein